MQQQDPAVDAAVKMEMVTSTEEQLLNSPMHRSQRVQ